MNDTQIVDQRVEDYVDEVSRALSGLDTDDRAALLEDVREHATAVLTDEPGIDLTQRLGSPRAFAHELLESAGISPLNRRQRRDWRARYERAKASRLGRVLVRASTDFAPAWAALRGIAATWLVIRLIGDERAEQMPLLLIAGGVAGWMLSARYQSFVRRGVAGRVLGYAANIATAIVGVLLLFSWVGSVAPSSVDSGPADPAGYNSITQNGNPNFGIQAFGPDGKPTPVALFDQDGVPLDTGGMAADNLSCAENLTAVPVPYLNSAGQPITNAYPARGVCVSAENVVVGAATAVTNGAPVQTWTASSLPASGQTILVDNNGAYAGLAADGATATPTPSGSPAMPSASPSAKATQTSTTK